MVFNAVIPMVIAFFRYKYETPLEIAVWQQALYLPAQKENDEDSAIQND